MRKFPAIAALAVFALSGAAVAAIAPEDSLEIARAALRDGLYGVARKYAIASGDAHAWEIIAESYAREENWEKVLVTAKSGYYLAAALYRTGRIDEAKAELADAEDDFSLALRARILLDEGDAGRSAELLGKIEKPDRDSQMMLAEAFVAMDKKSEAEAIWRKLLPDAYAAMNLGDEESLRAAYKAAESEALRQMTGLRLGRAMLDRQDGREKGAELIMAIVHDAPDTPGAKDAMFDLCEFRLTEGENAKALAGFAEMLEIWPETAKDWRIHSGKGWVNLREGRPAEALAAFNKAAALAPEDSDKALSLVKIGDCLSQLGRGAEAMAAYRKVLNDFPETPAAKRIGETVKVRELEVEGYEAYHEYRFEDAMKIFAKVAKADPSRRQAMEYGSMLCLYGLGRDEEAEAEAKRLDTPDARLWLAKFCYNGGRWGEARRLFDALDFPEAKLWAARSALADSDFASAIDIVAKMQEKGCDRKLTVEGMLVQGQALVELARFDEAVLVLERVALMPESGVAHRSKAMMLKADALYAMGADNPARYEQALETYRALRLAEGVDGSAKLQISFKIGRILEKQGHIAEAMEQYYTQVCLAFRLGREKGESFDDAAQAAFARAAFRLADEYEQMGQDKQARQILRMVVKSAVPASAEASRRIEQNRRKGRLL